MWVSKYLCEKNHIDNPIKSLSFLLENGKKDKEVEKQCKFRWELVNMISRELTLKSWILLVFYVFKALRKCNIY